LGCSAGLAFGYSYSFSTLLGLSSEAGSRPGGRVTFLARTRNVTQRMRPDCLRPCASLRANLRHAIRSAVRQNSLCATRAAQTGCRKFVHDALALCGANARSPNRVPQAQTHGWEQAASKSCGEIGFYLNHKLRLQLSNLMEAIFRYLAPCAHACNGGLLRLASAPQSADASCSNLRQRV